MRVQEIRNLLPSVFQRALRPGGPMAALLEVMERLHAPCESAIAEIDRILDPRRTPNSFVPLLAEWVDLDRLFQRRHRADELPPEQLLPSGLGRLRELIAMAAHLSQWRGTRHGLLMFLETATGLPGFQIDEQVPGPDGRPQPFHFRVQAPAEARNLSGLIERIVDSEKPAYVTAEIEYI